MVHLAPNNECYGCTFPYLVSFGENFVIFQGNRSIIKYVAKETNHVIDHPHRRHVNVMGTKNSDAAQVVCSIGDDSDLVCTQLDQTSPQQ